MSFIKLIPTVCVTMLIAGAATWVIDGWGSAVLLAGLAIPVAGVPIVAIDSVLSSVILCESHFEIHHGLFLPGPKRSIPYSSIVGVEANNERKIKVSYHPGLAGGGLASYVDYVILDAISSNELMADLRGRLHLAESCTA